MLKLYFSNYCPIFQRFADPSSVSVGEVGRGEDHVDGIDPITTVLTTCWRETLAALSDWVGQWLERWGAIRQHGDHMEHRLKIGKHTRIRFWNLLLHTQPKYTTGLLKRCIDMNQQHLLVHIEFQSYWNQHVDVRILLHRCWYSVSHKIYTWFCYGSRVLVIS